MSDFVGGVRENRGVTVALCEPVAAMSDCLDSVRGMLSGLDDKEITQTLRDIEALSRRAHAVMLELVAEADSRGIAAWEGFGSTAPLLAGMLQLSASRGADAGGARGHGEHSAHHDWRDVASATTRHRSRAGSEGDRDWAATGDHRDHGGLAGVSPGGGAGAR